MRLRLRCGSAYALGDFQCAMLHVPEHCVSVGDFANHVVRLLDLNSRGGDGGLPQFLLEGFLVPHSEELRIVLRDDEVVSVERGDTLGGIFGAEAGKRPLAALENGSATPSQGKRQRTGGAGKGSSGMMAIGWQPPTEPATSQKGALVPARPGNKSVAHSVASPAISAAKQPTKIAAAKAGSFKLQESSSSSSDDEEDAKPARAPAAKPAPVSSHAASSTSAPAMQALPAAQAGLKPSPEGARGLFVGGLPKDADDAQLRSLFERFGALESASVVVDKRTGKSRGHGFVDFADAASCSNALAAAGALQLAGKALDVKLKKEKGSGKGEDAAGKAGKDKGGKKGGKDKGGKGKSKSEDGKGKGKKGKKAAAKRLESSDSEEEDEEEDAAPAKAAVKTAAPAAREGSKPAKTSKAEPPALSSEEVELQKQMAALGLPTGFVGNLLPEGDDEEEDEDDEEDGEEEEQ
eukprot:TRINITY_DN3969_c0_g1_i1.p1 TRINITY_DN3969_c0_g1~~TRINITY_DN3969_c0_g1_i1.p1  ORF type:complete len:464 (+),score=163.97 TRINITY_DN3969_c0_g1_i1:112-1503(+)